jgi:adenine-specific DNA-methyltransferase
MILGDSLQVMASLSERESLKGKVQCIYFDPPYGIKFNSNWQVSTQSRDVKDGKQTDISREPEQVKAFRDTWKDGIHSYLTYLRDRLTAMRDLLTESGSIFVQISDENVHRVRDVMDEVFGAENFVSQIVFTKTAGATSEYLPGTYDIILFYCRNKSKLKFKPPYRRKILSGNGGSAYSRVRFADLTTRTLTVEEKFSPETLPVGSRVYRIDNLTSQSVGREKGEGAASWFPVRFQGREIRPSIRVRWKTSEGGMRNLLNAGRLESTGGGLYYVRYFDDFAVYAETDVWSDTGIAGFASDKQYVVETSTKVIERCLLMATDPGDLVLDPSRGGATTGGEGVAGRTLSTLHAIFEHAVRVGKISSNPAKGVRRLASTPRERRLSRAEIERLSDISGSAGATGRADRRLQYPGMVHLRRRLAARRHRRP